MGKSEYKLGDRVFVDITTTRSRLSGKGPDDQTGSGVVTNLNDYCCVTGVRHRKSVTWALFDDEAHLISRPARVGSP